MTSCTAVPAMAGAFELAGTISMMVLVAMAMPVALVRISSAIAFSNSTERSRSSMGSEEGASVHRQIPFQGNPAGRRYG